MNDLQIAEMTFNDFNQIASNLTTDFSDFWNSNILKSELENPNSKYIVAKLNNEVVGFAGIIDTLDQMEITNIVVKKHFRNKGIGTDLLNVLIEISKQNKRNVIFLEVNCNNISAINLYKKNGFKNVGLRKKYYNNTDDAILMSLKIY